MSWCLPVQHMYIPLVFIMLCLLLLHVKSAINISSSTSLSRTFVGRLLFLWPCSVDCTASLIMLSVSSFFSACIIFYCVLLYLCMYMNVPHCNVSGLLALLLLTLSVPHFLTVAKWVYQIVQDHTGLTHHFFFNFWHSGSLALSPERQRARMSKIKKWWVRPVWPWTLWGVTIWHHWALKG